MREALTFGVIGVGPCLAFCCENPLNPDPPCMQSPRRQVFPLPIEGAETRVLADDTEVVNYMISLGESLEQVLSHSGLRGCLRLLWGSGLGEEGRRGIIIYHFYLPHARTRNRRARSGSWAGTTPTPSPSRWVSCGDVC